MKNLQYLSYSVTNAFFGFMKHRALNYLMFRLKAVEDYYNEKNNSKEKLNFKFGEKDSIDYTLSDIKKCLSLPRSYNDYQMMINKIKIVISDIDPSNEIKIYVNPIKELV